jgi:hypothetical protein
MLVFLAAYLLSLAEIIEIRATGGVPIHIGSNSPDIIHVMLPGETAQVLGCEDTKSYLLIHVQLESGKTGYIFGGEYWLKQINMDIGSVFSDFGKVTISCAGSFENIREEKCHEFLRCPDNLSKNEVTKLQNLADGGDSEAAYRLAGYYDFINLDRERSMFYYRRAAHLGYQRAKAALGYRLVQSPDQVRKNEGIRWLRDAADEGDLDAALFLKWTGKS